MLIEVKDVEACPELIPTVILNENVVMYCIQKYFTSGAWLAIMGYSPEIDR